MNLFTSKDKNNSTECLLLSILCRSQFIFKLIYSKNGASTKRKLFNWVSTTWKDYLSSDSSIQFIFFRWLCGYSRVEVNVELLIIFNNCVRSIYFAELPLQVLSAQSLCPIVWTRRKSFSTEILSLNLLLSTTKWSFKHNFSFLKFFFKL